MKKEKFLAKVETLIMKQMEKENVNFSHVVFSCDEKNTYIKIKFYDNEYELPLEDVRQQHKESDLSVKEIYKNQIKGQIGDIIQRESCLMKPFTYKEFVNELTIATQYNKDKEYTVTMIEDVSGTKIPVLFLLSDSQDQKDELSEFVLVSDLYNFFHDSYHDRDPETSLRLSENMITWVRRNIEKIAEQMDVSAKNEIYPFIKNASIQSSDIKTKVVNDPENYDTCVSVNTIYNITPHLYKTYYLDTPFSQAPKKVYINQDLLQKYGLTIDEIENYNINSQHYQLENVRDNITQSNMNCENLNLPGMIILESNNNGILGMFNKQTINSLVSQLGDTIYFIPEDQNRIIVTNLSLVKLSNAMENYQNTQQNANEQKLNDFGCHVYQLDTNLWKEQEQISYSSVSNEITQEYTDDGMKTTEIYIGDIDLEEGFDY